MNIFISYAREQRTIGEEINASLSARGFDVFFDRHDLRTGEEYDHKIKTEIEARDLFICLVSPDFVRAGRYTNTEINIRRRAQPNPSGKTLPVMVKATLLKHVDPYLRAVTILYPQGSLSADVAAAVDDLITPTRLEDTRHARAFSGQQNDLLLGERLTAYKALWTLTQVLPKWPRRTDADYNDLNTFTTQLRNWYFVGGGGLFLSRTSQTAYYEIQNTLTAILGASPSGALSAEDYDAVRESCSALRSEMAHDIGAR